MSTSSAHPYENKSKASVRLAQIFSAKLVLEVFGGGGAIWGSSEAVTFRNPDTVYFWRPCAAIFGAIFFIRFILQIKDFVNDYMKLSQDGSSKEEKCNVFRFVQIFSAKFVLEVLGGGGAIWGSMEALDFRTPETQDFWRFWSCAFLLIFFIRFLLQARDYFHPHTKSSTTCPWTRMVQIFSAKFVLEVLGGAGAIWGWSEVITWRNPETIWFWRPVALTFGAVFFCRWILQICDYVGDEIPSVTITSYQMKRGAEIFSAKLVLEVFGGGGAIWGFSEALGLRTPETLWFWRPCALTFGVIFFFRWLMQINDFLVEKMKESSVYEKELSSVEERKELLTNKSPTHDYV